MADLSYFVEATTAGTGKDREGRLTVDGQSLPYSVPANMGGKGVGASPETLLISAVTACYSLTLLAYLKKRQLPYTDIAVRTQGIVTGFPAHDTYAKIIVNPTIRGGNPAQRQEYRDAAEESREHCFIGQTVAAGGVAYELGNVGVE
jgi:peroxiredoxin-like protein